MEIAKISFSESSCFCTCALSRCLSCTYCALSLFQVLQEVTWLIHGFSPPTEHVQTCIHFFVKPTFLACLLCVSPNAGEAEMNWEPVPQGPITDRFPAWHLTPQPCPDSGTLGPWQAEDNWYISMQVIHSLVELCQSLIGRKDKRDQRGLYEVAFEWGLLRSSLEVTSDL